MNPHLTQQYLNMSYKALKSRPHLWKIKDPELRSRYYVYMQQRNQALYRKEQWNFTFDQWHEIWQDHWHLRGRDRDSLCMSRISETLPWSRNNVWLITYGTHAHRRQCRRQDPNYDLEDSRIHYRPQ